MVEKSVITKVELNISGTDLLGTQNLLCVVFSFDSRASRFVELGRTEAVAEKIAPVWKETMEIDYCFETKQELRFIIQDISEQVIGMLDTTLGYLISKSESTNLLEGSNQGSIIIAARELKVEIETISVQLRAHNVDKMDFFGKSDPYFIVYKEEGSNNWVQVYKSEIIKKTLDPFWKPFQLTSEEFCNRDYDLSIKIECWDWDRGSKDDFIGSVLVSLKQLSVPHSRFQLVDSSKQKKNPKKYQNSGILEVENISIVKNHSFLDYLKAGTQISMCFGIDFTASNSDFRSKNSLHYFDENFHNEYERAIITLGGIIESYDRDKLFATFGFGAEPEWTKKIEHCFSINRNASSPYIFSISGVIQAYHQCLQCLRMAGPTLVQYVIRTAISIAQSSSPGEAYYILVLLIDGEIHDMSATISALVESSSLPLSIIIIGVGLDGFSSMQQLATFPLKDDSGRQSVRENVQFIQFKNVGGNPSVLAGVVLQNIPKQFLEYMRLIRYNPGENSERLQT